MIKVLVLGDVMGKIGRKALTKKLPDLRKKYNPDLVIVNCENAAHGTGISLKTFREIIDAGADFCTSGNHIWDKYEQLAEVLKDKELKNKLIRPANYKKVAKRKIGEGYKILTIKKQKIAIINLMGRVFMKKEEEFLNPPLKTLDKILKDLKKQKVSTILIDMHAEATSEKQALGWYADGRVSLIWGTHTHVPTADMKILPKKTGYITDLGFIGAKESILGESIEGAIESQKKEKGIKHNPPEKGTALVQGIYAEIEKNKTVKIKQVLEEVEVA